MMKRGDDGSLVRAVIFIYRRKRIWMIDVLFALVGEGVEQRARSGERVEKESKSYLRSNGMTKIRAFPLIG